jgi:hypothetical protein
MRVMRQYRDDAKRFEMNFDPLSVYPGRWHSKLVARLLWSLSSLLPSQRGYFAALRNELWDADVGWESPIAAPPTCG